MRVIGEDLDDAAFRDTPVGGMANHAAEFAAEAFEPCDLGFDVGENVARDAVNFGAGLIGFVHEPEQLANCVDWEAEFAGVADEGEAVGVRP